MNPLSSLERFRGLKTGNGLCYGREGTGSSRRHGCNRKFRRSIVYSVSPTGRSAVLSLVRGISHRLRLGNGLIPSVFLELNDTRHPTMVEETSLL